MWDGVYPHSIHGWHCVGRLPCLAGGLRQQEPHEAQHSLIQSPAPGIADCRDALLWERTRGLGQWQIKSESVLCTCVRKGQHTTAVPAREQTAGWRRWVFPLVKGRSILNAVSNCAACWETVAERQVQQSSAKSLWRLKHEVQGVSWELVQSEEEKVHHIAVSNCIIIL